MDAIHSGRKLNRESIAAILEHCGLERLPPEAYQEGIVGVARVARVVTESDDPWFTGPHGWLLSDVTPFPTPIPARGYQRLWRLLGEHEQACKRLIGES